VIINRRETTHDFEKQNLVTVRDRTGMYDLYKCTACGLTGKSYGIGGDITVSDRIKSASPKCPKVAAPKRIRITECRASGRVFANLTPGSEHTVVPAPEDQPDNLAGVWVMGVGEPVKVLVREYEEIN
jgi:hypothetical protein